MPKYVEDYADSPRNSPGRPTQPVNSALTTSLESLFVCENLVSQIHDRIHGAFPNKSVQHDGEVAMPSATSLLSNTLATRLAVLAEALKEIDASF